MLSIAFMVIGYIDHPSVSIRVHLWFFLRVLSFSFIFFVV